MSVRRILKMHPSSGKDNEPCVRRRWDSIGHTLRKTTSSFTCQVLSYNSQVRKKQRRPENKRDSLWGPGPPAEVNSLIANLNWWVAPRTRHHGFLVFSASISLLMRTVTAFPPWACNHSERSTLCRRGIGCGVKLKMRHNSLNKFTLNLRCEIYSSRF